MLSPFAKTILLLSASNVFMTLAWYGHLKELSHKPWVYAALASWGIALFEYLLQVPANRIGHGQMSIGQLKILQEVISLSVFVPVAVLYLRERLHEAAHHARLPVGGALPVRRGLLHVSGWAGRPLTGPGWSPGSPPARRTRHGPPTASATTLDGGPSSRHH